MKNTCFTKHARKYNSLYLNRFISQRCAVDMLELGLFPNAKEITESYGAYDAVVRHITKDLKNPEITVICPGDGTKPRTAATFAFRSAWTSFSIDPALQKESWPVRRLECLKLKIEDVSMEFFNPVIIVLVHAHCRIQECLKSIKAPSYDIVAMPCCVPLFLDGIDPDIEYQDPNIWSPENTIKIWRNYEPKKIS